MSDHNTPACQGAIGTIVEKVTRISTVSTEITNKNRFIPRGVPLVNVVTKSSAHIIADT
jgi:hypothetical protein